MNSPTEVQRLARELIEEHNLNAGMPTIEERVWKLKCRHMPDARIREIILHEFSDQNTTAPEIVVQTLPDDLDKPLGEWR